MFCPLATTLALFILLMSSPATANCLIKSYKTLISNGYPKISKVDGSPIYTSHAYIKRMKDHPKWKPFIEKIQEVRDDYAPRMQQRRADYQQNKDPAKPWIKAPGYGYERMRKDADKMIGKTVDEAFSKFNPGADFELIADGAKVIISPKNKVRGSDYVEVLYDVSGNYFRLQKGRFTGGRRLSFASEDLRYLDWDGGVINTERVSGKQFHELMEKSHWNALVGP